MAELSPSFGTDRTVFCAALDRDARKYVLAASRDGGRTWQVRHRVDATGSDPFVYGLRFSPSWTLDRTIYMATSYDVFAWNDQAARITDIGVDGREADRIVPYVETSSNAAPRHALVVVPDAWFFANVYDSSGVTRIVPGTVFSNRLFFLPPDYAKTRTAVALGSDSDLRVSSENHPNLTAYLCVGDFVCRAELFKFGFVSDVASGTLPNGGTFVLTIDRATGKYRLWRGSDHGRRWEPWGAFNTVLAPFNARRSGPLELEIVASPDAPARLLARLESHDRSVATPASQLFRSDDGGKSWRRVGYSRAVNERGSDRGTLPWVGGATVQSYGAYAASMTAQPGGKLFAVALRRTATGAVSTIFCSRNFGASWSQVC